MGTRVNVKRVYEEPAPGDGYRVLVDRLWPRGVRKEDARLDASAKDLAPSPELRQWFGHDPARFGEFGKLYREELAHRHAAIDALLADAGARLTLVYAAADPVHNHAVVLRDYIVEVATARPRS